MRRALRHPIPARRTIARLSLLPLLGALLLSLPLGACGDDDEDRNPRPGFDASDDPDNDTAADAPDGTGDDADAPGEDAEPDAPIPQNDQERILFLPETESWTFNALHGEVQVVRTEHNIPHVFATDPHDLAYVLGFVVARDRYFIMDLQRRLALGTLSELLGDLALTNDVESRMTGMGYVAQRILEGLDAEDAAFFDAYAEGVNAYIERVRAGELPPPSELGIASGLLGAARPADLMQPFDRRSIAAMVAVIVYQTNFDGSDPGRNADALALDGLFEGATKAELRRAGARRDVWDRQEPVFPVASTPGLGIYEGGQQQKDARPQPPAFEPAPVGLRKSLPPALAARVRQSLDRISLRLGRKEPENRGSNTWAVSGAHSTDGSGLVAGDGHLQLYVPALMYQIGMNTALFGGGDIHQAGLLITSLPLLAVGTNGHVAWSQVNPVADITDWYREELTLDAEGLPASSLFRGEQRPLTRTAESFVIADVPVLSSVGRTENLSRWTTFDGRWIFDVEGRPFVEGEPLGQGEQAIQLPGGVVVPGDIDGDGVVSAVSFDYTAFDLTGYVTALRGFTRAQTVYDYQESTRGLIGNMLYSAVTDDQGNILFTSYQGVPCRGYLPRDADGHWTPGADPTLLIDGTEYGGFTIPSHPDGTVDESQGEADPYRCAVPFDRTPQAINPPEGYVVNANNQPAPLTDDGRLDDDDYYVGGPWGEYRADSIARGLERAIAEDRADIDAMAEVQADTRSRLGELFVPGLLDTIARIRALGLVERLLLPWEQRALDLYTANDARFTEVEGRLAAWRDRGFNAASGVETFYHTPTADDRADASATMIFNAWLPRALQATFDDEDMGPAWRYSASRVQIRALRRFLDGRGPDNPAQLASFDPDTSESAFFDVLGTEDVEHSDELLLLALARALDFLTAAPDSPGLGGFGTADMDAWAWGLRHQVRFESPLADFLPPDSAFSLLTDMFAITTRQLPLAPDLPMGDPRRDLKWFPRSGDNFCVDAASPGFSGTRFTYGSGPVMRMVIALKDGQVRGQNIIPGGQSGLTTSPFFADQARAWLGNQTVPLRYHIPDIAAGATGRERYTPDP